MPMARELKVRRAGAASRRAAGRGASGLESSDDRPHTDMPLAQEAHAMAPLRKKSTMPTREAALPGRGTPLTVPEKHFVNGHRIVPPFPVGLREAVFGMGCFWGAERLFWEFPGV